MKKLDQQLEQIRHRKDEALRQAETLQRQERDLLLADQLRNNRQHKAMIVREIHLRQLIQKARHKISRKRYSIKVRLAFLKGVRREIAPLIEQEAQLLQELHSIEAAMEKLKNDLMKGLEPSLAATNPEPHHDPHDQTSQDPPLHRTTGVRVEHHV